MFAFVDFVSFFIYFFALFVCLVLFFYYFSCLAEHPPLPLCSLHCLISH